MKDKVILCVLNWTPYLLFMSTLDHLERSSSQDCFLSTNTSVILESDRKTTLIIKLYIKFQTIQHYFVSVNNINVTSVHIFWQ